MRKEEVFVRVSSEKKARKLAKLLDMFGESFGECTFSHLENEGGVVYFETDVNLWYKDFSGKSRDSKKVSLKELRNILAFQHLKRGDIIITSIVSTKYVVEFDRFLDTGIILGSKYRTIGNDLILTAGRFENFISYATEEEKELLEPKKELEVGKWYKTDNALFNHQNGFNSYGFLRGVWNNSNGGWRTNREDCVNCGEIIEATPQEVEEALINEAKRRYDIGNVVKYLDELHNNIELQGYAFNFDYGKNILYASTTFHELFRNGKWSEVIKPEKSLEERVKELEQKVKQLENR